MLGETGDPLELFIVDECDNNPLGAVMDVVKVSLLNNHFHMYRISTMLS